ncbi:hypothetical protein E3T55_03515 [Cryobacterium frigoriphilum]|uniref:Uncharacterized protein n=1 Tax=Cryobacterium frigoriphilum TaxID=1259150 RepID=A0A4R9A9T4_9MICO|nr:hypothetical protein [Cryobacterium frigoriphilum]TFD54502.1 hypothetical protein E3T55_03515 [Cryobacterium frigoriphilum]
MSNPTNAPDPTDPTDRTDRTDRAAGSTPSPDTAETRPLTGPTLVLPDLVATGGDSATPIITPTLPLTAPATAEADAAASAGARPTAATTQADPATPPAAPFAWDMPAASARHRPRFATILWGALLLGFAVFMVAWTLFPGTLDPTLWLLAAVIGVGLVLVVAGIAAATRHSD